MSDGATLDALLERHGTTYAEEAGIRLRDTPQPLYRLLVLSHLLSARIRAPVAVASARALSAHGMRSPRRMADATWQQRVDALGEGGYRRYDERTATQLGDGASLLLDAYGGDLRRLRRDADGDTDALRAALRRFPGMGPAGADIFLREVQSVWTEAAPYLDAKALQGAERLGLPASPAGLLRAAGDRDPAVLAAALVRAALDKEIAASVRAAR
ncbi:endonuclease [Streptomyces nitrosporeus]|uniref:Endonuclease n=1 Tax=Streptomyces nitrosporeus TaxID=28894 RepID=A0A5J6FII9_9ACTN|nr:endonuclease [Streptomyces nitrosporeus]QEU76188.1 endonuclease [Streptomyces nitrosporeus]GGZ08559.1 endonuclease [Streptomyces nitrosporeus]